DYTRAVMMRLGRVDFWHIAMRPGRPMAFGHIGKAWYFGLPGNPVAVMLSFCFLARPALLALAGATPAPPVHARAPARHAIAMRPGRPMAFGHIGKAWYFGLPGNPVAVMLSFCFLARPALLALAGATPAPPVYARARARHAIDKRIGRSEFQRGTIAAGRDG